MRLSDYKVTPSVAASGISRAAEFYEGKLGLRAGREQSDESRVYACGGDTSLHVYVSPTGAGSASAPVATWHVPDLDHVVDDLAANGVFFSRYEDPVLKTDEKGIHEMDGGRVAWFQDPDGNGFAIEERTP